MKAIQKLAAMMGIAAVAGPNPELREYAPMSPPPRSRHYSRVGRRGAQLKARAWKRGTLKQYNKNRGK